MENCDIEEPTPPPDPLGRDEEDWEDDVFVPLLDEVWPEENPECPF